MRRLTDVFRCGARKCSFWRELPPLQGEGGGEVALGYGDGFLHGEDQKPIPFPTFPLKGKEQEQERVVWIDLKASLGNSQTAPIS